MANKAAFELKTYKWGENSAIPQIDVRGDGVAYLYAAKDATDLPELRKVLQAKGLTTSSDIRNGDDAVLRVSGLSNTDDLLMLLESAGAIKGAPTISEVAPESKGSKWAAFKANSLRASGVFYTLGNFLYVLSGIQRGKDPSEGKGKQWGQMLTGISFQSGDLLLALVGKKDDKRQFTSLLTKLKKHLEKTGIEIPENSAISAETTIKTKGFFDKVYNFTHEHVYKFKSIAEVLGGFSYFWAGHKQGNKWKQATAVIFTTGFGSSLFIKEKKPDKEKLQHAGPLQKAWAFVQEKPLRIAGWSGLSNTLFTTIGAFQEKAKKPGKNFYKYDLATASSMLVANNLYAISNKNTGGSITQDGLIKDIYGIAAQVINRVPDAQREAAIKATVNFLGERTEIKDSHEKIDALLRQQMSQLNQNPWFKARSEGLTQATPETQDNAATLAAPVGKEGNWQRSVEASRQSAEQAPVKQ